MISKYSKNNYKYFSQIVFALIVYTLLVILWGAWVRISHSGDGCGNHWPLCHGELIPDEAEYKTWIEFGHRLMSGSFGIVVILIFVWSRKLFKQDHMARKFAKLMFIFTITEALLGAVLVKASLVGSSDSVMRAFVMALHLVNSLILVATVVGLWDFSRLSFQKRNSSPIELKHKLKNRIPMYFILGFMALACTGAIAALSTTLFPSEGLIEGLQNDFTPGSHYLLKWRGLHPILGVLIGGTLALGPWLLINLMQEKEKLLIKRSIHLSLSAFVGIVIGIVTLVLLSPLFLKLTHLLAIYIIWVNLILWVISYRYETK
jgi:heme a synthase